MPLPLPKLRVLACVLVALVPALAGAAPLRVATFNVFLGLGAPGTAAHGATRAILSRLDADVVALQEIQGADLTGTPSPVASLAAALGYPSIHLAETSRVFDSSSRVCFLSRHPIRSATNIVPPAGAMDMTRQIPAIVVDAPGTEDDPVLLTLHLKCCFDLDDPFRRAVELHRVVDYLDSSGFTASDPVIVLGDFNLVGFDQVYESLPSGLPPSYALGPDVTFPVTYSLAPAPYFAPLSMTALEARQLNGDDDTSGSSRLDHILATPALTSRPHGSEIYNSALDTSNTQGLPKAGSPLPADTSSTASDHLAVFADFELASLPALGLALSAPVVSESAPRGAVTLTVTLPSAPVLGQTIEVSLESSDPSEAVVSQASVSFGAGITTRVVEVVPRADALLDGTQSVTFTARAPGFESAEIELMVTEASPTSFTLTPGALTEADDFAAFDGSAAPSRWPVSGGVWRGLDNGTLAIPGLYTYGMNDDGSLGALLGGTPVSATATVTNLTGAPVGALRLAYDAEQWRSSPGGSADRISAELLVDGTPLALPELTFTANTALPVGAIPGGTSTSLETVARDLVIPHGVSVQLRFTFTPGGPGSGTVPADIFLNEIHYDNAGADEDEFVEIVVGPGFGGGLSEVAVVLYNGNGGNSYSTHSLDTFTHDQTTSSGHRIFSKAISGIQNGSPDGLAVVAEGTVLHFLSYGGFMTATDGPAAGMASKDIGVAQSNPAPQPGADSLGLTGSGGEASDFSWTRFSGPFTRGVPNSGQAFTSPAGSQGLAIDNVTVTVPSDGLDTDLDGTPDLTDPDDDNDGLPDELELALGTDPLLVDSDGNGTADGDEDADRDRQSNLAEVLVTLTDPADPNSRFTLTVEAHPGDPAAVVLSYPTVAGRNYLIEHSLDLRAWAFLASRAGDDSTQSVTVPRDPLESRRAYRVSAALP